MKILASALLTAVCTFSLLVGAEKPLKNLGIERQTQTQGYWRDPSTGLIWAAKDNGEDVSWKNAVKFCQQLRVSGFSDWRLASLQEQQAIYDSELLSTGYNPKSRWHDGEPMDFHVKGGLFLTGVQWTSSRILDDRGKPSGYAWRFDFNEGRPFDGDEVWFTTNKRALCTRQSN